MLNKAQVIGHLGQDPKIAYSQHGTIASFSVATTEKGYTTRDGMQIPDRTEWHNVVCFGRIADVVNTYLRKGSKVFVEGKMRTRQYEGKDGIKRSIMEINADTLEMLDGKPTIQQPLQQTSQELQQSLPQYSRQEKTDDELPF